MGSKEALALLKANYSAKFEKSFCRLTMDEQLIKIYGPAPEGPETRYSPAQCMGAFRLA